MSEEGKGPTYQWGRMQSAVFRHLPSMLLAEPFEIFLIVIAVVDCVTLALHEAQGTDSLFIGYFYGPAGLWSWIAFVLLGSVSMITGLIMTPKANVLKVRWFEVIGLVVYGLAFAFYGYTNLSIGLRHGPVVYPILAECSVASLTLACFVRSAALVNPVTALAVGRVLRIEMVKQVLRDAKR